MWALWLGFIFGSVIESMLMLGVAAGGYCGALTLGREVPRVHSPKLTWNLKRSSLKRTVVYKGLLFRFHLCLGDCKLASQDVQVRMARELVRHFLLYLIGVSGKGGRDSQKRPV